VTDPAVSPETQAFLSGVADEIEAAATKLESQNGAALHGSAGSSTSYLNARFGRKLAYTTCYMLSYGVCFPVFVACRYVPKNNQFVDGLVHGGEAASQAADEVLKSAREWRNARQQSANESLQESAAMDTGAEVLAPG
jgi:hypothetical protein